MPRSTVFLAIANYPFSRRNQTKPIIFREPFLLFEVILAVKTVPHSFFHNIQETIPVFSLPSAKQKPGPTARAFHG